MHDAGATVESRLAGAELFPDQLVADTEIPEIMVIQEPGLGLCEHPVHRFS
jgi:hypothetical protein